MNEYYVQGFIDKCAEHGVDPEQLIKASQDSNLLPVQRPYPGAQVPPQGNSPVAQPQQPGMLSRAGNMASQVLTAPVTAVQAAGTALGKASPAIEAGVGRVGNAAGGFMSRIGQGIKGVGNMLTSPAQMGARMGAGMFGKSSSTKQAEVKAILRKMLGREVMPGKSAAFGPMPGATGTPFTLVQGGLAAALTAALAGGGWMAYNKWKASQKPTLSQRMLGR